MGGVELEPWVCWSCELEQPAAAHRNPYPRGDGSSVDTCDGCEAVAVATIADTAFVRGQR